MLPSLNEILAARRILAEHLPRTPLYLNPALSRSLGFRVWVKQENFLPTGSFKPRGALYLLSQLREKGVKGVATASTGNHGLGVTFAAQALGMRSVIVIPEGSDALKVAKLKDLGADVRVFGPDLLESCSNAREVARNEQLAYVEDGEDYGLMVGAATLAAEVLEERPEIDAIFVPVGGGNLAGAVCRAVELVRPAVRVIGVQSEAAPAAFLSWQKGEWTLSDRCDTFAGGLATRYPGRFAFSVYSPRLSDFVLVSEDDLRKAVVGMLDATGFVAEGAAAAPLAACRRYPGRWRCANACFLFTGGNLARQTLAEILTS
jgi:threonine dehydratase